MANWSSSRNEVMYLIIALLSYAIILAVTSYSQVVDGSNNSETAKNITANSGGINQSITFGEPKVVESEPTGNYTTIINGTSMNIAPPKQSQPEPRPSLEINSNNMLDGIQLKPITKEQASRAEQEANAMIKAYYEELEEKNEASALAIAQPNQTMGTLQEETRCVAGEVSAQVGNSTVCLSPYEISIACNQGGSLFGDPLCSGSAGISSIQQPGLGQTPPEEEEEVIDETAAGQGQQPGSGEEEEEVIEEGDGGEQEVIEDFE